MEFFIPKQNKRVTITENMVIGRKEGHILLSEERTVSGKHCQVVKKDNAFFLKDLNSGNGTFINGKKIEQENLHLLEVGQEIRIGNVKMVVEGKSLSLLTKSSFASYHFHILSGGSCFPLNMLRQIINAIVIIFLALSYQWMEKSNSWFPVIMFYVGMFILYVSNKVKLIINNRNLDCYLFLNFVHFQIALDKLELVNCDKGKRNIKLRIEDNELTLFSLKEENVTSFLNDLVHVLNQDKIKTVEWVDYYLLNSPLSIYLLKKNIAYRFIVMLLITSVTLIIFNFNNHAEIASFALAVCVFLIIPLWK
jgi:hypothetical protein